MEDELGVTLFHRDRHRVQLTDAGQAVLEEARGALTQANKVAVVARRASKGLCGNLRVGFSSSVPHTMLPNILRAFRSRFPEVRLTLDERSTEEQIELLTAGIIDVGFPRLPLENTPTSLLIKPILREPLILALPKKHPLGRLSTVPVRALATEQFILFPRHAAPGLYHQIEGICRVAGFKPYVAQEAFQIQTIISLVSAGLGVAIVPASIRSLHREQVLYRPLQGSKAMTEMALAYEKENRSFVLRSFLSVVSEVKT